MIEGWACPACHVSNEEIGARARRRVAPTRHPCRRADFGDRGCGLGCRRVATPTIVSISPRLLAEKGGWLERSVDG